MAETSVAVDRLLSRHDVCERLNISVRTLDHIVRAGRLPGVRVSPVLLRFRSNDVERYIAERTGLPQERRA